MRVSAIVVTKGGYGLGAVLRGLREFDETVVWDNSQEPEDLKVFGRFEAMKRARNDVVVVQDDDCTIPALRSLPSLYEPGRLVTNMPSRYRTATYRGTGMALIGFGAIFDRRLADFTPYLRRFPKDELFLRECDRVFTYLNRERTTLVDLSVVHMERALGADRMWREGRHGKDLMEIQARLSTL